MLSFRGSDVGETAAPSLSRGMRSPAFPKRDADEPLKRPVREPWSIRNTSWSSRCLVGYIQCKYYYTVLSDSWHALKNLVLQAKIKQTILLNPNSLAVV